MPAAKRRAQLALYKDAALLPTAEVPLPEPYGRPIDELGPAQDGFPGSTACWYAAIMATPSTALTST
ncbi:hypothetical protein K458DRAFT_423183 [Lentithecium fluviatile CBS 122367]|uniref:Uncharacterized protein n=1 Tax=Lentithecium fluviatile CBS 122367 TaxID=1168545 RepID=A0A6G1IJB2_9PLEO|nr:hypothetical protein K458DRAFT_423183 [Lentithecium fluviatile CBS 122367]